MLKNQHEAIFLIYSLFPFMPCRTALKRNCYIILYYHISIQFASSLLNQISNTSMSVRAITEYVILGIMVLVIES